MPPSRRRSFEQPQQHGVDVGLVGEIVDDLDAVWATGGGTGNGPVFVYGRDTVRNLPVHRHG
jgi:hypothetical protein